MGKYKNKFTLLLNTILTGSCSKKSIKGISVKFKLKQIKQYNRSHYQHSKLCTMFIFNGNIMLKYF